MNQVTGDFFFGGGRLDQASFADGLLEALSGIVI